MFHSIYFHASDVRLCYFFATIFAAYLFIHLIGHLEAWISLSKDKLVGLKVLWLQKWNFCSEQMCWIIDVKHNINYFDLYIENLWIQSSSTLFIALFGCCFTSLLCWYRKQRLSNHWQRVSIPSWIHQCDVFEWSHCYSQPRRPPLVLVSYLFHKQKKISKLGWAAIWQSVCLKLIFNTRKIFDMYRQCHASWVLTQLFFGMLQLLVCPFTPAFNIYSTIQMLTKIVNNIRVKPTLVNTQNNKINIDNHLQCRKNKFAGFVFCS